MVANSMKSFTPALAIDGSEDGLISYFKKRRNGKQGEIFNDDKLRKNPSEVSPEDMVDAAPVFNVIDIDGKLEIVLFH